MEIIAPQNGLFDFIEAHPLFSDLHNPVAPPEKAERVGADRFDPVVECRVAPRGERCFDPPFSRVPDKGDTWSELRIPLPGFARKSDNAGFGAPVDSGSRNSDYLFHPGSGVRPQFSARGKDKANRVMRHRGVKIPKEGRGGDESGGHGN